MADLEIDLNLLPMKAQFFLWNAGTAPLVPFLPTYAKQLGFSSVVVGIVYAILPGIGMLAKPVFGAVADLYKCQKLLFVIFQIVTAIAFFGIQFIPEIPLENPLLFYCHKGLMRLNACNNRNDTYILDECSKEAFLLCEVSCKNSTFWEDVCEWSSKKEYCDAAKNNYEFIFFANISMSDTENYGSCTIFKIENPLLHNGVKVPLCNNPTKSICSMSCHQNHINRLIRNQVENSEVPYLYQFWLFIALLIVSWVGMAVVVSIGDAICFGMLGDKPSRYGHQRLWGAVGWGIFSLIAGLLVDNFSHGQLNKDYTSVFYLMLIMLLLDVAVSSRLKYSQTKLSASLVRDVGRVISEPHIVVFLLWIIVVGFATGLVWQFLFWHLEELAKKEGCGSLDWIKTLEGLVMAIQCFGGEVPFFFLSGKILKKIGHVHTMTLVLLGIALRFILYSQLTNPWWCLPIELFQGITFGVFYATMASYASIVAPPGTEATVQGLVGALFEGVGVSLGSLLGGILIGAYGGHTTFLVFGLGSLVLFVLHIIVQYFLSRVQNNNFSKDGYNSTALYAAPQEAVQILGSEAQT